MLFSDLIPSSSLNQRRRKTIMKTTPDSTAGLTTSSLIHMERRGIARYAEQIPRCGWAFASGFITPSHFARCQVHVEIILEWALRET
jgi:hypothetical protein